MPNKQDSNLTGLRFAEEESVKTLPVSGVVWYALEPNSYGDFGGQLTAVARNPINPGRQRKKGTLTDMEASGNFNQDLTVNNLTRLLQGFFFADAREKATTAPLNAAAIAATSVTGSTHKIVFGTTPPTIAAGTLVATKNFTNAANNGLFVVASTDTDDITTTAGLVDEASPPAAAYVEVVGYQFNSGTSAIALNGNLVRLTDSAKDMTTLGLIVGEWVYVGADNAGNRFTTNVGGWARVSAIAAGYLEFDKTRWDASAETGTGKAIHIYFGLVLKNEDDPALIKRRTYQLERTLGEDDDGVMAEYLTGAVLNELTINVATADKITVDITAVALDHEIVDGATGVKDGDRPAMPGEEALNTSNDFGHINVGAVDINDATTVPMFAFLTDMSLTINNNAQALKAIGVFGGFDVSAGTFEVGGSAEAYFGDTAAMQAVRGYDDTTIDFVVVKSQQGLLFDVPLLAFGDGRLAVEQDQAIKLPLETAAGESRFGHTLLMQRFSYLPLVAEA